MFLLKMNLLVEIYDEYLITKKGDLCIF